MYVCNERMYVLQYDNFRLQIRKNTLIFHLVNIKCYAQFCNFYKFCKNILIILLIGFSFV